jgi:MtN3 and saliva related transmembrane protein
MPLETRDIVGYAAAILTTMAFIPQVIKSWRTRDLSGVSLTMYSLFTAGVTLWLVYGIILGAWPIIVANTITVALASVMLALKVIHR